MFMLKSSIQRRIALNKFTQIASTHYQKMSQHFSLSKGGSNIGLEKNVPAEFEAKKFCV